MFSLIFIVVGMLKRIFWPISAITVIVLGVLTWSAIHYTSLSWEAQASRKLAHVADVMARDPAMFTPAALVRIKALIEADVLIYNYKGKMVLGTVQASDDMPYFSSVPANLLKEILARGILIVPVKSRGKVPARQLFKVLNLAGRNAVILSLVVSEAERLRFVREISWTIGVTALSGLILLWIFSYQVARFVSDPLEELASAMERAGAGKWDVLVPEKGPPELVAVARSFNYLIGQLKEYKRLIQEAERDATAGAMAAGLAHEIRNPLTSLKVAAQMLCEFLKDSPRELKRAEAIVRESRRLEKILNDLLARSRQELHRRREDLNDLVRQVGELAGEELLARGLSIRMELDPDLPPVMMDGEKIEQVIWNLIRNAADAMNAPGEIVLRTLCVRAPVSGVCLQVDDNGQGLDDEALRRAFKPFFTTKEKGTGLGLAICREIVRRHGGELTLANLPEKGARAEMCLPTEGV